MTRIQASLLLAVLLAACSSDSATSAEAKASAGGSNPTQIGVVVSGPAVSKDGVALGQLVATEHVDLNALVNRSPTEVEAVLGTPTKIGTDRISCVRFVPERVFFACEQEARLYDHPPFDQIRVEFEDGRAAKVAISGLPGTGAFDPDAALSMVGIRMPEAPAHDNPRMGMGGESSDVVDRWEWVNSRARMRIQGQEFRVRLSVINGEWKRAKVEVINNSPLDDDQRARIKQPRGEDGAGEGAGEQVSSSEP